MCWGGGERERQSLFLPPRPPLSCSRLTFNPRLAALPPCPAALFQSTALCVMSDCLKRGGQRKKEKEAQSDEATVIWQKGYKRGEYKGWREGKNREKYMGCQVWSTRRERQRLESEKEAGLPRQQPWETKIRADQQSTITPSISNLAFTFFSHSLFQSFSSFASCYSVLFSFLPFGPHCCAHSVFL